MSFAKILALIVVAITGSILFVGCAVWGQYNKVVALDESVDSSWAQVENQMQRRVDLMGNLVETVKGFANQEKDIFLGVAKARESYFQAKSPAQKASAANGISSALSRLLVLRETYPELKSNESFLKLQDEIAGTENRLAVERKRYNDAVEQLNGYIRRLGGRLVAAIAGVEKREYFKAGESAKEVPKVDFSTEPAPATDG